MNLMNLMNCITLTLNQIFNLLVIINKDNMVSLRGGQGATHALTAPTPTAPAPTGPASTAHASGKKQWDWKLIALSVIGFILIISLIVNISSYYTMSNHLGLDGLYDDFKGNEDPDSRMIATIDISTDEGDCKFDLLYEYDDYREVTTISGEPDTCDKYNYSKSTGEVNKEFLNRMLDEEYLDRY